MKKILSALVAVAFAIPVLAQTPAAAPAAPAACRRRRSGRPGRCPGCPAAKPAAAAPAAPAAKPAGDGPGQEGDQEEGQEGPAGHHDAAPADQVVERLILVAWRAGCASQSALSFSPRVPCPSAPRSSPSSR